MPAGLTRLIRPLALMTLIKNLGRHTYQPVRATLMPSRETRIPRERGDHRARKTRRRTGTGQNRGVEEMETRIAAAHLQFRRRRDHRPWGESARWMRRPCLHRHRSCHGPGGRKRHRAPSSHRRRHPLSGGDHWSYRNSVRLRRTPPSTIKSVVEDSASPTITP
jgi:hypothetical protein